MLFTAEWTIDVDREKRLMDVSRHREFFLSIGEYEQRFVFLQAECFSGAIQLFSRIDEFDVMLAGAKWNCSLDLCPFHPAAFLR